MYEFLLVLAVLVFLMLKYRETFVVKYGNPFNDEDIISFDANAKGNRLFGITPDTCPANKPEYDAGLCYEQCEVGYNGVGPVCWADTVNIGIGKVVLLKSCAESGYPGWTDTGLLCNEPIECGKGWEFFTKGCWGGRVKPKNLSCDGYSDNRENVDGLCYRKCPPEMPKHVPAMPYLCFKGTRGLSYGRGVGDVPPIFAFGE
jgi:hypothetical protein